MADTFTGVDLSRLPAPTIVEPLDFDTIYAAMLAQLQVLLPSFDATVESDPAVKVLQVAAYREMLLRARVNDAAKAVMIPFAGGADLDNLGAIFGITRLTIDDGDSDQGIAPTYETDTAFRRRITLAPEGFSVAGPTGAYIFHALSADPDVLDASAVSPSAGQVLVTVLSRIGSGAASPALLNAVTAHLTADDRRPLTDMVTVQSAAIVDYEIIAAITFFAGPDSSIVMASIQQRLADYIAASRRLGRDITRSGIIAAIHVEGVQNVALAWPAADIVITTAQAANCAGITLTNVGVGE